MWVKLDDNFPEHWKVFEAGRPLGASGPGRVAAIYVEGLCYANRNLTDGFLPRAVVAKFKLDRRPLDVAHVLALPEVQLWEEVPGGWGIHHYHDHNPTAAEVKERRDWDARRKQLYATPGLIEAIRSRDRDRCRYCGGGVNWRDRRGPNGGTYDHVIPRGPNTIENVVVACSHCNIGKGQRTPEQWGHALLPPPSDPAPTTARRDSDQERTSSNQVSNQSESRLTRARDPNPNPNPNPSTEFVTQSSDVSEIPERTSIHPKETAAKIAAGHAGC